jgi:hypothetical protein
MPQYRTNPVGNYFNIQLKVEHDENAIALTYSCLLNGNIFTERLPQPTGKLFKDFRPSVCFYACLFEVKMKGYSRLAHTRKTV